MSQTDAPIDDPTALARFAGLDVAARLLVEGYMMGQHKSPYKGSSVEFVEHRQYYPGDEIRHIDWRAFGKTGRYYVKEFEEETNLRSYLVVDGSGSMGYGESTISKFTYARYLAAAMGYLLLGQRDAVGLVTFDTQVQERVDPTVAPHNFQRLINTLQDWETGGETSLAGVFQKLIPTLKRRSLVIIISDFFDSIEPLGQALKAFQHSRHEVILFQVVAPEEQDFPFSKPTLFRSLERGDHRVLVDPHRLRARYVENFRGFQQSIVEMCRNSGVDLVQLTTKEPYAKALGAYLDSRSRSKGKR
jgi:uncharacterized protein (DUF58 family)